MRYILRSLEGEYTLIRPGTNRPYEYPSYMAAVRGAAMVDHRAIIVKQEIEHEV